MSTKKTNKQTKRQIKKRVKLLAEKNSFYKFKIKTVQISAYLHKIDSFD